MKPPSVDRLARSLEHVDLPFPLLVESVREAVRAGDPDRAEEMAIRRTRQLLQPVINATGVLLHTNLGRAPVDSELRGAYQSLEYDLSTGARGDRSVHAAALLALVTNAEAAFVVNNGAAAVMLTMRTLAHNQDVVVSRGELVEIGGSFRVPDVLTESGARLVEVGTTNRTRCADYERALADERFDVGAVLKVHQSNFRLEGFVEEASVQQLGALPVPLIVDLGSGLLDARCPWLEGPPPAWLAREPAVKQTLASGADLVTFSGDKLLGGPQAGIIAGNAELVAKCARQPLARALRPGGQVLALLQSTVLAYLRNEGDRIPLWRMAGADNDSLRQRGLAVARAGSIPTDRVSPTTAVMGGGTLPGESIPSWGLHLPSSFSELLRNQTPAIIARVHRDQTIVDFRTIDPADDTFVAKVLAGLDGPW